MMELERELGDQHSQPSRALRAILEDGEPIHLKDLAARSGLSHSATKRVVHRLAAAGRIGTRRVNGGLLALPGGLLRGASAFHALLLVFAALNVVDLSQTAWALQEAVAAEANPLAAAAFAAWGATGLVALKGLMLSVCTGWLIVVHRLRPRVGWGAMLVLLAVGGAAVVQNALVLAVA